MLSRLIEAHRQLRVRYYNVQMFSHTSRERELIEQINLHAKGSRQHGQLERKIGHHRMMREYFSLRRTPWLKP